MRMSIGISGVFLLIFISSPFHCKSLLVAGSEKPMTLSEAIQLLQLNSIKQLKKTIKDMGDANRELERKILIVEEEKNDNLNQSEQQKTQIKEDLERKKLGMEKEMEMKQIKEDLNLKLNKAQIKCQKEKDALDQEHSEELINMKNGLVKSQSIVEYMSDILLHSHKMIEERQKMIETQEKVIREKNQESQIFKTITTKQLAVNEKAIQTISLQEENINLLKASLSSSSNLSKLSTQDLDNLNVAPFMVELMESYNEQTTMVENLRIVLEKDNEIDTQISDMVNGIANTSSTVNLINKNWDTMEQQARMIQMQSKSISLLRPLLGSNPNMTDIIWFNEEEDGAIMEASSCGCLPRAPQPTNLSASQIEYQCEGQGNRSYSLTCESGVCGTEKLPSCEEPVIWENVDISFENCQVVNFDNNTHLCGKGWREEKKTSGAIGAGLWTEVVNTPCSDCGDLSIALDWQPWRTCTDGEGNMDRPDKVCRRRGNNKIGFQEEEKEYSCVAPWTQLSTGCYRLKEQQMTWREAKQFCQTNQAKLVEIESAEENRAIIQEIKRQGYKGRKIEFWLGLTDLNSEGDWRLESTGESPLYFNWGKNEPNGAKSGEDCAHINSNYEFNDKKCNEASRSNGYTWNALCEKL